MSEWTTERLEALLEEVMALIEAINISKHTNETKIREILYLGLIMMKIDQLRSEITNTH